MFPTRSFDGGCWVYSATLGGGLVGGDEIRMIVEVGAGSRAVLTTQASTKIYRSLRPASQDISASIADDALLAMLPDPVVCFADADFSQRQRYDLSARANLVLVDWMTSGRHACGERWAFRRYASRIDIWRSDQRLLYEHLLLDSDDGSIGERLGHFDVCLTAVITGPDVSSAGTELIRAASARPIDNHADLVLSAWPVAGGALVRVAGRGVEPVGAALREQLGFLRRFVGGDPWERKW